MLRPSQNSSRQPFIAPVMLMMLLALPANPLARGDQPPQVRQVAANLPVNVNNDFQVTIETSEVVDGRASQSQERHLVLFKDGKVYDFALTKPHDVTVVDPAGGQIVLLSHNQHVKSTIPTADIVTATAKFRVLATSEGVQDRLGLNAKVIQPEGQNLPYQIGFGNYHYELTTAPPTLPLQPARFAEFTDWVARVNLVRRLGTPPFARISLGHAIAADGQVPKTVVLQLKSGDHQRTFQSQYTFKNGLSSDAEKRLDEVAGMMTLYREVPPEAFPK